MSLLAGHNIPIEFAFLALVKPAAMNKAMTAPLPSGPLPFLTGLSFRLCSYAGVFPVRSNCTCVTLDLPVLDLCAPSQIVGDDMPRRPAFARYDLRPA